jgi:hypothetical protein
MNIRNHPERAAAQLAFSELGAAIAALDTRIVEIRTTLEPYTSAALDVAAAAAAILAGTEAPSDGAIVKKLRAELTIVLAKRDVLSQAQALRQAELNSIDARLDHHLWQSDFGGRHVELLRRTHAALLELEAVEIAEVALRAETRRAGVTWFARESVVWDPVLGSLVDNAAHFRARVAALNRYAIAAAPAR